jgi:hypothetical protein
MMRPSMQVREVLALLLHATADLVPTEIGADVSNAQRFPHQEGVQLQSVVDGLRYLCDHVLRLVDLGLLYFGQLVVIQNYHSDCWL